MYECAAGSTLHGVSHICYPGKFRFKKFLWLVVFCVAMGYFFMHTYESVIKYLSYPHITGKPFPSFDDWDVLKLKSNSAIDEKQADGTMDFPSVTICNVNSIRISKLSKEDIFHVGQFFGLIQNDGVSLCYFPIRGPFRPWTKFIAEFMRHQLR